MSNAQWGGCALGKDFKVIQSVLPHNAVGRLITPSGLSQFGVQ